MKRVRIVNESGSPFGTRVLDADTGEAIDNVHDIDISAAHGELSCRLSLVMASIDIVAEVTEEDPEYFAPVKYAVPIKQRSAAIQAVKDAGGTLVPDCEDFN